MKYRYQQKRFLKKNNKINKKNPSILFYRNKNTQGERIGSTIQ